MRPGHDAVGADDDERAVRSARRLEVGAERARPAPLGSKSESCGIETPSFSRNALAATVRRGDAVDLRALGAELVDDLLVDLQLVGADRAEGERVEDQDGRLALEVVLREVARRPPSSA